MKLKDLYLTIPPQISVDNSFENMTYHHYNVIPILACFYIFNLIIIVIIITEELAKCLIDTLLKFKRRRLKNN